MSTLPPRGLALPEKEALRGSPHLYESFKKIEDWMRRASQFLADMSTAAPVVSAGAAASVAFEPVQDGTDPRVWTLPDPSPKSWVKDSIRIYWEGQRLQTSLLVLSGVGNRTLTLDPSVGIALGDFIEGEGVKA